MQLFKKPIDSKTLALLDSGDKRSVKYFNWLSRHTKNSDVAHDALEKLVEMKRNGKADSTSLKALAAEINPNHTLWNRVTGALTMRRTSIFYDLALLKNHLNPELLEKQAAELKN